MNRGDFVHACTTASAVALEQPLHMNGASGDALANAASSNRYAFVGGTEGEWEVTRMSAYRGSGLKAVESIKVLHGDIQQPRDGEWILHGVTSNVRYATGAEVEVLKTRQPALGRPEATGAALIPIKKSEGWWSLAQDKRRTTFEETSHHNATGMERIFASNARPGSRFTAWAWCRLRDKTC